MIVVKNLTVIVDHTPVVQNFSLDILKGSIHALMGKNGSGKSSLAYSLVGLPSYQISAGSMHFLGQDIAELSIAERSKAGIFLAFQQPIAIPGVSVFQFLKEIYALKAAGTTPQQFQELVQHCFDQVGLDHAFLYRSLHDNFSGGEKKRLEIVQMLLLKPQFIMLDEIDSGLDVDALKAVGSAVARYLQENKDVSCLIITHYRRILEYIQPDFVHVMHGGNIVHSGDSNVAYEVEQQGYDSYGA